MHEYRQAFDAYMGVKTKPNSHELALFARAKKYITKLNWIPGIEMVAVGNSLSMFATHEESDIDLFIITRPGTLWFTRLCVTLTLWMYGVWRHGTDIAGNFCLSFWMTTEAMNLEHIAIDNDIYLYNWIYHLKPILTRGDAYEQFLRANGWVEIDKEQKQENRRYLLDRKEGNGAWGQGTVQKFSKKKIFEQGGKHTIEEQCDTGASLPATNGFGTFATKSTEGKSLGSYINSLICFFWLPKTLRKYKQLGSPEGVIISDNMLKFHDRDRRTEVRDKIFQKNFDK